ncbi:unnamed protein product [Amoebophrya sp. A120]|nr:unnamed protein product [Amoebophrya sp. A120]|eukprot:GSA120T00018704001.1
MPPRRSKREGKRGANQQNPDDPDAPKIHPEVQKVLDFEALLEAEAKNEVAAKVQKDRILKRCFDAFGHNLCGPDPVLNSTSLALVVEIFFIAKELGFDLDFNPNAICEIPNKLEQMHEERDNPMLASMPKEKLGLVTGIHFALRGAAKRLEKEHLWGTFTDLLRMTHRRDAELYRIVYFDLLKDIVDDIVDEDDEEERKYLWMSCSPYPQDHRCPYVIRSMLEEDGWTEMADYSMKRKYHHVYRHELSLDTEDPEKAKNLFKLSPLSFIDVCVPEKWNHFHFLLPNSHYEAMAQKLIDDEFKRKGKIDLTVKKPKNKNEEKKMAKDKAEKEQMVAMFDSSDTDEDDFFEDKDMDPETRKTAEEREIMNNENVLDLMQQDETIMESGLLGLSHAELPCYVLWNLCRSLRITMIGLRPGGCMVLIWGTTPLHASFFWLKQQLQPFFDDVNLLSSPFPSMESLVVCSGYSGRISQVDPFCYFLTRPHRAMGIDDILLWTFGDGNKSIEEMWDRDRREIEDLLMDYKTKIEKLERYTIDMEKEKVLQEIERIKEAMREAERAAREAEGAAQEAEAEKSPKKKKSPRKKKPGEKDEGELKKKKTVENIDAKASLKRKNSRVRPGGGEMTREVQEGEKVQRRRRKTVIKEGMKSAQLEKLVKFRNREPDAKAGAEVNHIVMTAMDDASPQNRSLRAAAAGSDPTCMTMTVSRERIDQIQKDVIDSMRPEPLSPMRKREFNPYRNKLRKLIGKREDDIKQMGAKGSMRGGAGRRGRGGGQGSSDDDDEFGVLPDVSHAERGGGEEGDEGEDADGEEHSMIKMVNKKGKKKHGKDNASTEFDGADSSLLLRGPSHSRWDRPWRRDGVRNPVPADLKNGPSTASQKRPVHLATSLGVGSLDQIRDTELFAKFQEELNPVTAFGDKDEIYEFLSNSANFLRDTGDTNVRHVYEAWTRQYDKWRENKGLPPRQKYHIDLPSSTSGSRSGTAASGSRPAPGPPEGATGGGEGGGD